MSLNDQAISVICKVFNCKQSDIYNIQTLKKGMTNRSFTFCINEKKYIMRIPGEGTENLINRHNEKAVYDEIMDKNICDKLYYIDENNGFKISSFLENSRCCNPHNQNDLVMCMKKLKSFHDLRLVVPHTFDLFSQINFYESLWNEKSIFSDYEQTKENVFMLKKFIDACKVEKVLCHIDSVPDNFLFCKKDDEASAEKAENAEELQLIDWEYAGMQDPHLDIAMFCVYAMYESQKEIDNLIDIYFENNCDDVTRIKIYCYVAVSGLLWSNWCEYKRQLGVEFGEYSLMQYKYAKDYSKIVFGSDVWKKLIKP